MANYITLSRIILIIPVLYLASNDAVFANWIALSLYVIAGITDHLDGYVARKTKTTTSLGGLLDLIADKLLICLPLLYLLSIFSYEVLIIPSLIIVARELVVSSLRQYLVEGFGKNPVKVSFIAKAKTAIQITSISFLIISPNFGEYFFYITIFLFWFAAYISLQSLYGYVKTYKNLLK